ncbi:2-keto-4-pentenoate hydratase [Sphingomonas sp. ID0503]|uniref:2-keto-4-pentenoate hydratase n=1 Tax=Sphingomonas sp. ID0503 TaxID=3399691 RepID=UPI003AFA59CD
MATDHPAIAARLRAAYTGGVVPPLRDALEPTDADGAYAVQSINVAHWQRQGRKLVGRKVGLTAKAVQAQLGVDRPDFGALFADMAVPNGGEVDPTRLIQPKAEAEVAFVMGRTVDDPNLSVEDLAAAIDHAAAAIEIVDSRIADWKITFADTVADNGSSALFVLGDDRRKLDGLDLYTCGMAMTQNGAVVSLGAGAACLGHPLNAVRWLAATLAERGEALQAGDVVLSGALGPMVAFGPGDRLEAKIGGLGSVGFSCGVRS